MFHWRPFSNLADWWESTSNLHSERNLIPQPSVHGFSDPKHRQHQQVPCQKTLRTVLRDERLLIATKSHTSWRGLMWYTFIVSLIQQFWLSCWAGREGYWGPGRKGSNMKKYYVKDTHESPFVSLAWLAGQTSIMEPSADTLKPRGDTDKHVYPVCRLTLSGQSALVSLHIISFPASTLREVQHIIPEDLDSFTVWVIMLVNNNNILRTTDHDWRRNNRQSLTYFIYSDYLESSWLWPINHRVWQLFLKLITTQTLNYLLLQLPCPRLSCFVSTICIDQLSQMGDLQDPSKTSTLIQRNREKLDRTERKHWSLAASSYGHPRPHPPTLITRPITSCYTSALCPSEHVLLSRCVNEPGPVKGSTQNSNKPCIKLQSGLYCKNTAFTTSWFSSSTSTSL